MVVASLIKCTDFVPSVFRYVVYFTLILSVVGVLRADRVNVVFGFEFKTAVQMAKLVTSSPIQHRSAPLDFKGLFIDNK